MPIQEHIMPGEILELKLEKSIGYAYVRFIDTKEEFRQQRRYFSLIDKISGVSKEKISDLEIKELKPLICNLAFGGAIPFVGKYKLKRVGIQRENSFLDPIYIRSSRFSMDEPFDEREKWWTIKDFDQSKGPIYMSLEKIKHLPINFLSTIKERITLITMIWIRRIGEDIKDYYTQQEFKANLWLDIYYKYAVGVVFLENIEQQYWYQPLP